MWRKYKCIRKIPIKKPALNLRDRLGSDGFVHGAGGAELHLDPFPSVEFSIQGSAEFQRAVVYSDTGDRDLILRFARLGDEYAKWDLAPPRVLQLFRCRRVGPEDGDWANSVSDATQAEALKVAGRTERRRANRVLVTRSWSFVVGERKVAFRLLGESEDEVPRRDDWAMFLHSFFSNVHPTAWRDQFSSY